MITAARARRVSLLVALSVLMGGYTPASAPAAKRSGGLGVMQYNIYQGNEFEDGYRANSPNELSRALAKTYQKIKASNIPARAAALAAEIKASRPALIGLSEASLYRTQFPSNPTRPATHVLYDYVTLLLRALRAKGLHYRAVPITATTDTQLVANLPHGATDFRYTDRVAVLARAGVTVSSAQGATFLTHGNVSMGGAPVVLQDGYASVDATLGRQQFRFIATHLSALTAPDVRNAQAAELVRGPLQTALPVVVACDCNSVVNSTVYSTLAGAGLRDTWAQLHPGQPGVTCCHAPDLRGTKYVTRTRLDYVWQRGASRILAATVVGDKRRERTRAGLWPSDHNGLTVRLAFPGG